MATTSCLSPGLLLLLCGLTGSSSLVLHSVGGCCRPCPIPASRRAVHPVAQLVRIDSDDPDRGDEESDAQPGAGGDEDSTILQVSQIEDAEGNTMDATGRSVASVQFMITKAMRAQLAALGYSSDEIDRMDPPRAADILAKGVPSSKQPQVKPKTKRDRFELQFTCNVCDAPNSHSISWHAYRKGTVLATCPSCKSSHLIADNLNWIEDDFKNLEEYMAKQGTPVKRLVTDGSAASAAEASAVALEEEFDMQAEAGGAEGGVDPRRPWAGTMPAQKPIDGISDEQAMRIRQALRESKARKQQQGNADKGGDGGGDE